MDFLNKFQPQREVINPNRNHEIKQSTDGFRVNITLLSLIISSRMDAPIFDYEKKLSKTSIEKSIPRPMDFTNSQIGWLDYIKNEAKELMNKIHEQEEEEKQYQKEKLLQKQEEFQKTRRDFYQEMGFLRK